MVIRLYVRRSLAHGSHGGKVVKITVLVEGKTETAFKPILLSFLKKRLGEKMPKLDFFPCHGGIFTGDKLRRTVETLLREKSPSDHVIALSDVYGTIFSSAEDAKKKMSDWVGEETRFSPHVALYDFEAWLLPYWSDIQRLAGHNKSMPASNPETVNNSNPPADRIKEVFEIGKSRNSYSKVRDATRILRDNDLGVAISQCAELKAFVNTIIRISGGLEIN